jgi:hypothetical protein
MLTLDRFTMHGKDVFLKRHLKLGDDCQQKGESIRSLDECKEKGLLLRNGCNCHTYFTYFRVIRFFTYAVVANLKPGTHYPHVT